MSDKIKKTQLEAGVVLDSLNATGSDTDRPIQTPVTAASYLGYPYMNVWGEGEGWLEGFEVVIDYSPARNFVSADPNQFDGQLFRIAVGQGINSLTTFKDPIPGQISSGQGWFYQFDPIRDTWNWYVPGNLPFFVVTTKTDDGVGVSEGQTVARGDTPTVPEWGDGYTIYQKTFSGWVGRDAKSGNCLIYRLDTLTFEVYDSDLQIFTPIVVATHTHTNVVSGGDSGYMTGADKAILDKFPTTIRATPQTTDNTPTETAASLALTGGDGSVFYAVAHVSATISDGTVGMAKKIVSVFRKASGTWTKVVDTAPFSLGPTIVQAGFTGSVDIVLSGSNAVVQITGIAATTINWNICLQME